MAKRPIFYDTETTGLKPDKDHIIEIAAYDPTQGKTFHSLINPECPIPPDATAIHSISDEMVQKAPTFKEVGARFSDFCKKDAVLIAHNNDAFDQPFLTHEFARCSLPFLPYSFIDSLKFARKYRPDLPRYSLQDLREYFGIPPNQAHRALDDVIILHKVFSEMIDDLTMEMILEIMSEKRIIRTMPFGKHRGKPLKEIPYDYIKWLHQNGGLDRPGNEELKESLLELGMLPSAAGKSK
jgi:DNA polymerase-3 subunit epsilon